jgi:hypothetical protein
METSQRNSDSNDDGYAPPARMPAVVSWLQRVTLAWMLVETVSGSASIIQCD